MEFSKAYEYFKKHFYHIEVVLLDGQAWITNGQVLLQAENVPREVHNRMQSWEWDCSETCSVAPRKCEYNAECCPNNTTDFCDLTYSCEKFPATCGHGEFLINEWTTSRLTPKSTGRLLEACPTTEIKPDKTKQIDGKQRKMFISDFTAQDIGVNMTLFRLFPGKGLTYYQEAFDPLKEIYVKSKAGNLLGIIMPLNL